MPKLALAQMAMSTSIEENVANSVNMLERGAGEGADLVLFPEIHFSPFFPKHLALDADEYRFEVNHPVIERFRQACREIRVFASPNFYLDEGGEAFDASLLIDRKGEILGISKMVHITQSPGFYEQNYYTPSQEGFHVFDTEIGKIGIVICFDRHYPESFRACIRQGADIVLVPTANLVGEPLEMFEWELRVSAFQNSVYIALCNRVGDEEGSVYCGGSMLVGPDGSVVHKMGGEQGVDTAPYDLDFVRSMRRRNPFLKLWSPDLSYIPAQREGAG